MLLTSLSNKRHACICCAASVHRNGKCNPFGNRKIAMCLQLRKNYNRLDCNFCRIQTWKWRLLASHHGKMKYSSPNVYTFLPQNSYQPPTFMDHPKLPTLPTKLQGTRKDPQRDVDNTALWLTRCWRILRHILVVNVLKLTVTGSKFLVISLKKCSWKARIKI